MNFLEMQTLILDDPAFATATSLQTKEAINFIIDFYSRQTFFFNTEKLTLTAVVGTEYYTIAGSVNFKNVHSFKMVTYAYGVNRLSILHAHKDEDLQRLLPNATDEPYAYSYSQLRLRVYPTPKTAGTITVVAASRVIPLISSADTNVFLEYAIKLVELGSKRYLAASVFNDKALTDKYGSFEGIELASLRGETESKHIQVSNIETPVRPVEAVQ